MAGRTVSATAPSSISAVEAAARERLANELAELPGWESPELWARVRGERQPPPSLGAVAFLLAEAGRRHSPEAMRALFTCLLARIELSNQRWAAGLARRTPRLSGPAAYAVREDLCQELALRLWQRLALEPSEPWQLFFGRALDYERRHVAAAYMARNGHWLRMATHGSRRGPARVPPLLERPWDELRDLPADGALERAELADLTVYVLRLPPRERAAVVLRFWQQAGEAQIAATLGVTPRTVRNLLRRAYGRLRAWYGDLEEHV